MFERTLPDNCHRPLTCNACSGGVNVGSQGTKRRVEELCKVRTECDTAYLQNTSFWLAETSFEQVCFEDQQYLG